MKIIVLTLILVSFSELAAGENCAQNRLEAENQTFAKSFRKSYEAAEDAKLISREEALDIAKNYSNTKDVYWGAVSVGSLWVVRFSHCSAFMRGGAGTMLISSAKKSVVHVKWER